MRNAVSVNHYVAAERRLKHYTTRLNAPTHEFRLFYVFLYLLFFLLVADPLLNPWFILLFDYTRGSTVWVSPGCQIFESDSCNEKIQKIELELICFCCLPMYHLYRNGSTEGQNHFCRKNLNKRRKNAQYCDLSNIYLTMTMNWTTWFQLNIFLIKDLKNHNINVKQNFISKLTM